jgi:hypothetical protein
MSLNADEIYNQVIKAGEAWADYKAAFEYLDDMTKTIHADILADYLPPTCPTKGEVEVRAFASKAYKEHLAAKSAARKAWLQAEVKYKGLNLLAELRRSQASNSAVSSCCRSAARGPSGSPSLA